MFLSCHLDTAVQHVDNTVYNILWTKEYKISGHAIYIITHTAYHVWTTRYNTSKYVFWTRGITPGQHGIFCFCSDREGVSRPSNRSAGRGIFAIRKCSTPRSSTAGLSWASRVTGTYPSAWVVIWLCRVLVLSWFCFLCFFLCFALYLYPLPPPISRCCFFFVFLFCAFIDYYAMVRVAVMVLLFILETSKNMLFLKQKMAVQQYGRRGCKHKRRCRLRLLVLIVYR